MIHRIEAAGARRERAIILGGEHPRALAFVQSLGRAGIEVLVVHYHKSPLSFYSRYAARTFAIEDTDAAALKLLDELAPGGGMIVATNDRYMVFAARHYRALARNYILTTPPWETLRTMIDLSRFYHAARACGLDTPEFFKPGDEREMRDYIAGLDFRHSYLLRTPPATEPADAATGRFTKVAGDSAAEAMDNSLEIYRRLGDFPLIVKVVPGEADRCIGVSMVVDRSGGVSALHAIRRLKLFTYSSGGRFLHPYSLGSNVFCESAHDDEAAAAATRLVRRMGYFGPITLEFRRDLSDGKLVLIKADPRPVRATALSRALGCDLPLALYRVFTGGKAEAAPAYADGVAWLWMSQYLSSLASNRSNRPVARELLALALKFRSIKAIANYSSGDPMPLVVELKRWLFAFVTRRLSGIRRRALGWRSDAPQAESVP
jgi:predicted ATP-grasp superfamily ATP-dependent carboligase